MGKAVDRLAMELVKLPEREWERVRDIQSEIGAEPDEVRPPSPDTVGSDPRSGDSGDT